LILRLPNSTSAGGRWGVGQVRQRINPVTRRSHLSARCPTNGRGSGHCLRRRQRV
jgi:hypothetical protein